MAELGFVGDGPNSYQFWFGGSPNQTRLAEPFQDRVKIQVRMFSSSREEAGNDRLLLQALMWGWKGSKY